MKPIYDITKFTMLDYPDELACIIWFTGCNMRCQYCYNPNIVFNEGTLTERDALKFLEQRRNRLDAVVLSGGEATLYSDIIDFSQKVKSMGFKIKLDTNGLKPDLVKQLVKQQLIDYIALDFKAMPSKFEEVVGIKPTAFDRFTTTLNFLISSDLPFEVRTTIHADLLSPKDVSEMANFLEVSGYKGTYYLQKYLHTGETLGQLEEPKLPFDTANITSAQKIELRNF